MLNSHLVQNGITKCRFKLQVLFHKSLSSLLADRFDLFPSVIYFESFSRHLYAISRPSFVMNGSLL